jgi:hypothetical protein
MTEELARRCEHAIHVITPDGIVLTAGRASLYLLDAIGWHRFSALFSTRPLLWLVEATYRLVAAHRTWFSRFFFLAGPGIDPDGAARSPSAPPAADVRAHERVASVRPEVDDIRLDRLKPVLCLALASGVLLGGKLWLSSRDYPLMPVWSGLPPIPFPFDYVMVAALILVLGAVAVARRPGRPLAALLLIAGGLSILDQTRWQPWLYQYLFMFGALARYHWGHTTGVVALNSCRVIMASTYLWSGLHKLNREFATQTFAWILGFLHPLPAHLASRYLILLAVGAALGEASLGVGLMTVRWRRPAVVAAILMHLFILITLRKIMLLWPWNIAMIAFIVLLFSNTQLRAREILSPRNGWYHVAVVILFAILPALSLVHLWDSYLSFAMFSGDVKGARVYISDGVRADLPSTVRAYVTKDEQGRNLLDMYRWSNSEVHVPPYPETRTFRRFAMYACRYAKAPTDVELVIAQRSLPALWRSVMRLRLEPTLYRTTSHYDCESLRR